VFALALSVFGAPWLNQRNTEMLVEQLGQRFDQRIDSLEKRFDQRMDSLEKRLDQRLDSLDQRVGRIERQLEAIFKPSLPK
jgi:putative heme iron utilization protein